MCKTVITSVFVFTVLISSIAMAYSEYISPEVIKPGFFVENLDEAYGICYNNSKNVQQKYACLEDATGRYADDISYSIKVVESMPAGGGKQQFQQLIQTLSDGRSLVAGGMHDGGADEYTLTAADTATMYSIRNALMSIAGHVSMRGIK